MKLKECGACSKWISRKLTDGAPESSWSNDPARFNDGELMGCGGASLNWWPGNRGNPHWRCSVLVREKYRCNSWAYDTPERRGLTLPSSGHIRFASMSYRGRYLILWASNSAIIFV